MRRLREAGLVARWARHYERKLAEQATRDKRVTWARGWDDWARFSDRTVYVDVATFQSGSRHKRRVTVPKTTRGRVPDFVPICGRVSVAVFGGLCGDELLPLYVVSGKFTSEQYKDVLSELYWPVLRDKFGDSSFRYQQDNSPVHRGSVVRDWLATEPDFDRSVVFQPPYSPDLNPIEHVWAAMKKALRGRAFTTAPSLVEAVIQEYDRLNSDKEFLAGLTSSMPRRINAVLEAEGGPTKY